MESVVLERKEKRRGREKRREKERKRGEEKREKKERERERSSHDGE